MKRTSACGLLRILAVAVLVSVLAQPCDAADEIQTRGVPKWKTHATISAMPPTLWQAFQRQVLAGERIADAGKPFASGCVAIGDEPRQGFVHAGSRENAAFVVWMQGGFATATKIAVFQLLNNIWTLHGIGNTTLTDWEKAKLGRNGAERNEPDRYFYLAEKLLAERRVRAQ